MPVSVAPLGAVRSMLMLAWFTVKESLTLVSEAMGAVRPRTTNSGVAMDCFSDWGVEAEPFSANRFAMTSPVLLRTNSLRRSGTPVRTFRVPRSLQGDEAAREAVCARRVRTLVVAEGLPIFPNRGSRSPSAGLRFAWGRRTLRVLHLANRANDFHWHHRMAHLSHEPFCLALAPQSEFLPSGVTAGQAEDRAAGELRRSCRHELRLIRTKMMSWHAISPGGLPLR